MSREEEAQAEIERLEARVSELERILGERSRILRYLAREVCDDDLLTFSRATCGLPPLPRAGFGLRGWRETTALSSGDVDRTMRELWRALTPPGNAPEDERREGDGRKIRA